MVERCAEMLLLVDVALAGQVIPDGWPAVWLGQPASRAVFLVGVVSMNNVGGWALACICKMFSFASS